MAPLDNLLGFVGIRDNPVEEGLMCCEVEDSSLNVPTRADLEHEVKEYRLIKAMIVDKLEGFSNYALSISREDFREHLHGEISGVIEVYITETAKHFRKMLAVCINNKAHIFGELCENLSESIDSDLPAANPLWGDISSMTTMIGQVEDEMDFLDLSSRQSAKLHELFKRALRMEDLLMILNQNIQDLNLELLKTKGALMQGGAGGAGQSEDLKAFLELVRSLYPCHIEPSRPVSSVDMAVICYRYCLEIRLWVAVRMFGAQDAILDPLQAADAIIDLEHKFHDIRIADMLSKTEDIVDELDEHAGAGPATPVANRGAQGLPHNAGRGGAAPAPSGAARPPSARALMGLGNDSFGGARQRPTLRSRPAVLEQMHQEQAPVPTIRTFTQAIAWQDFGD